MSDFDINTRNGLPPELAQMLPDLPRPEWPAHHAYDGLAGHWLDIHGGLKKLGKTVLSDCQLALDKKMDPMAHANRVGQLGNMLLNHLHTHHQIEDHVLFPRLDALDPTFRRGFDMLETDHTVLDALLNDFAGTANDVLRQAGEGPKDWPTVIDPLHQILVRLDGFLDRHLADEEDLVIPLTLKHEIMDMG